MSECLQEEVLQSYLDGELRAQRVEQVASHLTSCLTCSAFARQLEQENSVLATALALEFESAVPSERLRQRIDAAIASARVEAAAGQTSSSSFGSWLSTLFAFTPQRALGYASLMLIVGFGLIMGMMRWQTSPTVQPPVAFAPVTPAVNPAPGGNTPAPVSGTSATEVQVAAVANNPRPRRNALISRATSPPNESNLNHVKLLPGERSYLQTIAQLDSTIKAEKATMKPGVQAEYQRNLAFVDRTLAVARTAAKSNPNDPDATEFMFSAYQSKVDLLNTVAQARVLDK